MKPPEIYLPYFGKLQQDQRWKLSLASENETQGPLSPPVLHSSIRGHISSSGDQ